MNDNEHKTGALSNGNGVGKMAGRPRKKIDQKQFEQLCALQCTLEEMCGFFECCTDTLETWCKRTYKKNFSEVFKEKRGLGKISLRRAQFRLAEKNAPMAIWLGKQYLGQRDDPEKDKLESGDGIEQTVIIDDIGSVSE